MSSKKNVISVTDKMTGKRLVYSNLTVFLKLNNDVKKNAVKYHIYRLKKPYEDNRFIIEKQPIIYV